MASEQPSDSVLVEETVTAPALPSGLDALHGALTRFWSEVDAVMHHPPDPAQRLRLETAAMEIATNIIRHAHPPGAPQGTMHLRLRAHADRIEILFTDHGLAFHPPEPAARPAEAADEPADLIAIPEGGYGLALMRATVDEVDYERSREGANVWRLLTWLDPAAPDG